jgi:transposase
MTKRKTYTRAFKLEAVKLLESGDKSAEQLARELGVRRNSLYKWQKELQLRGDGAFSNKPGRKPPADAELARLKRENERLQEEVEILKKAAAYFARDLE